jgi:hypothetical protein
LISSLIFIISIIAFRRERAIRLWKIKEFKFF